MKKKESLLFRTVVILVFIKILDGLEKFVSTITKYFPFSLLPERFYVHYKNRDILKAWGYLSAILSKTGTYFHVINVDKDNPYFIYFKGVFENRPTADKVKNFMKLLEKRVGNGNVFLQKDNTDTAIVFNKEAINKTLLV